MFGKINSFASGKKRFYLFSRKENLFNNILIAVSKKGDTEMTDLA
jgi:hypothetical protein